MKCIKCSKDTTGNDIFCPECLADMELHPVKPGTPIKLPQRDTAPPPKRSRRYAPRREAKISSLQATIRWLLVLIMVLVIALTVTVSMLLHLLDKQQVNPLPGQNYHTSESVEN